LIDAGQVEQGGGNVNNRRNAVHLFALRYPGLAHQQRRAQDAVVVQPLAHQAVVAEVVAVIAQEDDDRVVSLPGGVQCVDDASDTVIE